MNTDYLSGLKRYTDTDEIENCRQAMEHASDLYDFETYIQYRERYKELTGAYPGKQLLNSLYGRMSREDENNDKD